jgi:hypothetical protein
MEGRLVAAGRHGGDGPIETRRFAQQDGHRWTTEGENVNVMRDDTTDSEESRKERANRELIEMLNELRVALPGVQVLFAFLLTVPFSVGFSEVSDFQRSAYFVTLVASALASGLLIAPAAQHRVLFRQHDKENLLRRSNRYATAGVGGTGSGDHRRGDPRPRLHLRPGRLPW